MFLFKGDKRKDFWKWFEKYKVNLEHIIDSKTKDLTFYHGLTKELHKFNNGIFPELTKKKDGTYVLIITPDGLAKGIEPTKEIVAACPGFTNWEIVRFRQPADEISMGYQGIKYETQDIEIIPSIDSEKDKVNVVIFIRNMNKDEKKYQTLAFLYLDHILGEFNTITKVGSIVFRHLDEGKTIENSINLLQLRKLIEDKLY
jgi:hypothetical protein